MTTEIRPTGGDETPSWEMPPAGPAAQSLDGPAAQPLADALLTSPPSTVSDEDLTAALSAPPPTARSLRLTKVLVTALVLVLGFVAGILVNQRWGDSDGQVAGPSGDRGSMGEGTMPSGFPSGMAFPGGDGTGATGSGQAGSGGQGGSAPTSGEVTLVDGDVIYLTQSDGTQVRVEVGDDTTISKSTSADLGDVEEGDTVTVTGTTTDSGLTATSVEVSK